MRFLRRLPRLHGRARGGSLPRYQPSPGERLVVLSEGGAVPDQRIVCSCSHLEREHAVDGPCRGRDSYGLPCECPGVEVDGYWSGLTAEADGE
jgi:hypothetical protein